jgi:hypothetical protein
LADFFFRIGDAIFLKPKGLMSGPTKKEVPDMEDVDLIKYVTNTNTNNKAKCRPCGAVYCVYSRVKSRNTKEFKDLPLEAEKYNRCFEVKAKCKGSKHTDDESCENNVEDGALPKLDAPLQCLDVFAGCGGLSHGLHQTGAVISKWAIEVFEPAAKAFKTNNPDTVVFTDDCNLLLKKVIDADEGKDVLHNGKMMPKKGEVDLLCGGPPCQGFSGINGLTRGNIQISRIHSSPHTFR